MRPATLVDGWVIFYGGHCRKLTFRERLRRRLGGLKTVKP